MKNKKTLSNGGGNGNKTRRILGVERRHSRAVTASDRPHAVGWGRVLYRRGHRRLLCVVHSTHLCSRAVHQLQTARGVWQVPSCRPERSDEAGSGRLHRIHSRLPYLKYYSVEAGSARLGPPSLRLRENFVAGCCVLQLMTCYCTRAHRTERPTKYFQVQRKREIYSLFIWIVKAFMLIRYFPNTWWNFNADPGFNFVSKCTRISYWCWLTDGQPGARVQNCSMVPCDRFGGPCMRSPSACNIALTAPLTWPVKELFKLQRKVGY